MSGSETSEIVGVNSRIADFFSGIVGWLAAIVFFFPVFWMVQTSFCLLYTSPSPRDRG